MINTFSVFYFGINVTSANQFINFNEGSGELTATLTTGRYSHTDFATEIQDQMNAVGTLAYTVTFNRTDRTITISAPSNFDLLISSGSQSGSSTFGLAGFTGADLTGASTYTGNTGAGSEYLPQYLLQDYLDERDNKSFIRPSVNETSSGRVETIQFGSIRMFEMNITFISDFDFGHGGPIETNLSGVANANSFMEDIIEKGNFEFMPDRQTRSTFHKVLLDSTPESSDGIAYRLRELVGQNLQGIYQTGLLRMRIVT